MSSGDGPWVQGAGYTEIVPASTITFDFVIEAVSFSDLQSNYVYELQLFYGESNILACVTRPYQDGLNSSFISVNTTIIPANSKITAKLAWDSAGVRDANIHIMYHRC